MLGEKFLILTGSQLMKWRKKANAKVTAWSSQTRDARMKLCELMQVCVGDR